MSAAGAKQGKGKGNKRSEKVRPRRDFEALRKRRMRAAGLFKKGVRQADVARELGVSAETASEWYRLWSQGGREALVGPKRAGRMPRVGDKDLKGVEKKLLAGAKANGFDTDLWTLARVAAVIESETGVAYSQSQTWEILRNRLGWTRQRPARKALERDDEAIVTWIKTEWPRIKKVPAGGAPGSSSKTRAGSRSSRR